MADRLRKELVFQPLLRKSAQAELRRLRKKYFPNFDGEEELVPALARARAGPRWARVGAAVAGNGNPLRRRAEPARSAAMHHTVFAFTGHLRVSRAGGGRARHSCTSWRATPAPDAAHPSEQFARHYAAGVALRDTQYGRLACTGARGFTTDPSRYIRQTFSDIDIVNIARAVAVSQHCNTALQIRDNNTENNALGSGMAESMAFVKRA
ncbi:Protein of unknown function [Gryllus bimaculatus]|nr:Protein of unknown function [Gryllus bimaculatus]